MSEQRRLAASTAVFGAATAVSRVAGVIREIVAASFFGASPALGAFLIAFNVPNLVRSLVADSAISAAFVPVFVQLREEGREPEAWRGGGLVPWLPAGRPWGGSRPFSPFSPPPDALCRRPTQRTPTH